VPIDPEIIRARYAEMADEELRLIDRKELTSSAQQFFDHEFSRRNLTNDNSYPEVENDAVPVEKFSKPTPLRVESDWMASAFTVSTFLATNSSPAAASDARDALEAAGIPCRIVENEVMPTPQDSLPYVEYQLMVPSALTLQAVSALDKAIYNANFAEELKNELEGLTEKEFGALDPEELCSGLLDRVERLRKVFKNEVSRRNSIVSQ